MTPDLSENLHRNLERLARRLNGYVGSVAFGSEKSNDYLMVSYADYLLLRQAYYHAMNRSSRRRLRNKLFQKIDYARLSDEAGGELGNIEITDTERPFLHLLFDRSCGSRYAVLKVRNIRHMEYLLYVRQSAFREMLYRAQ